MLPTVVRSHQAATGTDALVARLSAGDRDRLAGLADGPASAFLAGRAALQTAAARLLGNGSAGAEAPVIDATCPDCALAHGRPRIPARPEIRLALAHAAGMAFAVAATEPVGIDAEPLDAPPERIAGAAALAPGPGDALRRWTAIEAVLKADGRGLRVDPAEVLLRGRTGTLDGEVYRLVSRRVEGCRVTIARLAGRQPVSDGNRV